MLPTDPSTDPPVAIDTSPLEALPATAKDLTATDPLVDPVLDPPDITKSPPLPPRDDPPLTFTTPPAESL
jgi:hypothetical protein